MTKLIYTLKSRKFWVAVSAAIAFTAQGQYTEAIGVMIGWAVVEGWLDGKRMAAGQRDLND